MDAWLSMTGISVRFGGGETACENRAVVDSRPELAG